MYAMNGTALPAFTDFRGHSQFLLYRRKNTRGVHRGLPDAVGHDVRLETTLIQRRHRK
jgi:hypothetical protein